MAEIAPDIGYVNQPLAPTIGSDGVRKLIKELMDRSALIEWQLMNLFGKGDVVCTERLDCWDFDGGGFDVKLPCTGMFDLDVDGKIAGWRDYFDIQYWSSHGDPSLEL